MEEKNTMLVQTNVSLEEELRKANAAKSQLESYKRQVPDRRPCWLSRSARDFAWRLIGCLLCAQVVELQNRLSEESKKADKMEFEYKRVKEKVDSLQKEKDVCTVQLVNVTTLLDCSQMLERQLLFVSAANADRERLSEGDDRGAALCPGSGGTAHDRYTPGLGTYANVPLRFVL